jgi:hypothetical protein
MWPRVAGAQGCRFDSLPELRHDRNVTVLNRHRLTYSLDQAASPGAILAPDTPAGLDADSLAAFRLASAGPALAGVSGCHYSHAVTRAISARMPDRNTTSARPSNIASLIIALLLPATSAGSRFRYRLASS